MPSQQNMQKFRKAENFPVASLLLPSRGRSAVLALYRFARAADEIADSPTLASSEKKKQLQQLRAALQQGDVHSMAYDARDYWRACNAGKMNLKHGLSLLDAFIQDAEKQEYASWEETLSYCRCSAATIGRSLLEACGEFGADVKFSDDICNVLQLINHLQDLKKDREQLSRQYFDKSFFPNVEDVLQQKESPSVTEGKHKVIAKLRDMLNPASALIPQISSFRVRAEIATIYKVAQKLLDKLSTSDILEKRVELSRAEKRSAAIKGVLWAARSTFTKKYSSGHMAYGSGSSFIAPLLSLKAERRRAMLCYYSLCRHLDDIADSNEPKDVVLTKLAEWDDEIESMYSAEALHLPQHSLAREMALYVRCYGIEKQHLLELIEGQRMDANNLMLRPQLVLLNTYCYRVASCVGLVSARIFGYSESNRQAVEKFATELGLGLQYINIIRDVREDAGVGRIYLAAEKLQKAGIGNITPLEIYSNYAHAEVVLEPLLKEMAATAEAYIDSAMQILPEEERDNMRAALLMKHVYLKYLEKMKRKRFLFDRKDIKLTFIEKLKLLYEPAGKI